MEEKAKDQDFGIKDMKHVSRKSAIPATNATKNQKQTMSLTTYSTESGMYYSVLFGIYWKWYKSLK